MQKTDNEEVKEYLKGYSRAVRQMNRLEERIKEIRSQGMGGAIRIDGMPHAHNNTDLSSYAAMLDQEERNYIEARYERIKICQKITKQIEQLENEDEKDVLMYRYIRLLKWEDICVKMSVSWKQVHRVHANALISFRNKNDIE